MERQTCVVEMSQQLFFLHKLLIQPVSQSLCLHRNLFYRVHPEGNRRDRQIGRDETHKKKKITYYIQQKLSALIRCGSCSPNSGCQPWSLSRAVYFKLESITAACVFAEASACFGNSLAGRLIRVSQGDRSAEGRPDRRQSSNVASQNGC